MNPISSTRQVRAIAASAVLLLAIAPLGLARAQTSTGAIAYGARADGYAVGALLETPLPVELRYGSVRGEVGSTPHAQGLGAVIDWGFVGGAAFVLNGMRPPTQAESLWPSGPVHDDQSVVPPVASPDGQIDYGAGRAVSDSAQGPRTDNVGAVQDLRAGPAESPLSVGSARSTNEVLGPEAADGRITAKVTTTLQDVDIGNGSIRIDTLTSVSEISLDGNTPQGRSRTVMHGVVVEGQPTTIGSDGVVVGGEQAAPPDAFSQALAEVGASSSPVGITVTALDPRTTVDEAEGRIDTMAGGLRVVFHNTDAQQTYTFSLARTTASLAANVLGAATSAPGEDVAGVTLSDNDTAPGAGGDRGDVGGFDIGPSAPADGSAPSSVTGSVPAGDTAAGATDGTGIEQQALTQPTTSARVSLEMKDVYLALVALALAGVVGRTAWARLAMGRPEVTS